ncbi:MAG: flagellar biosynthesis protein FlhB [Candidatus Pristimantibacillus lignocellulolyticus]|uniref:Flagellar biosynthetic protein FlhB n=1 Tax=Candidatus Pristimantibacillus lignocellulolyticus TaxID=2994561 RepID=A0A9J6ZBJ3_9BACL|nr:MAG: flagellar biosynthesis protein FlhB [Candidatus Pristimantibacillus lignocellulolyticus]
MQKYALHLDLQLFNQEKTEKATPKKVSDERKKGQVAKSQELPAALILTLVFASFMMLGGYYETHFMRLFTNLFENWLTLELTAGNLGDFFVSIMLEIIILLAPIFAIVMLVGVIGNVVQFGFLLTGEPLQPKLSKLNPIEGFKRIFSMRSLVEFAKSLLKVTIIGMMVYSIISAEWVTIQGLALQPLDVVFAYAASLVLRLGITIGAILVALALLDYMYQKYENAKSLRMSKQDIKDEHKKSEGDPLIKSKIREKQLRMAISRMMQEIPNADVVITNPTHFAVALKYDSSNMEAPKVIAKGKDHLALKIREVAKEHGVITLENKPLARALYSQAEIGDSIPADLFQAVAEVLAYVYKLKGSKKKRK